VAWVQDLIIKENDMLGVKIIYYLAFLNLAFLFGELAFNVAATVFWGN